VGALPNRQSPMVIDGGRWRRSCRSALPTRRSILLSHENFWKLSPKSVSIQPRPSPPFCSGPAPVRPIAPTAPSLLSSLWGAAAHDRRHQQHGAFALWT
jgi:hypothetical protein